MPEDPDARATDTKAADADDYEYDLAHEVTGAPDAPARPATQEQPPGLHVGDDGGDYAYDLAHDMP